ncbi:MAG TPA: PIG-L family deacetylase, partial [Tepidisphaeraceae bacterium]
VVLSFLAHPDDAEILCGGTLIRLVELGWEVHIATCTAGDAGSMTQNRWEISAIRTAEAAKAAAMIGATYHCLDERDLLVVYDKPTIQKAIDLFRRIAPSLVFAHAPRDYMMDHEQASLLARGASFGYGCPNASVLPLLRGSGIPYLYYCDPIEGIDIFGAPVSPTTVIDVSRQMDRKLEMLAQHASQRQWLAAHHGMDEYLEATRRHGAARGKLIDASFAEGFVQHRGHAYPADDLLAGLVGSPTLERQ